MLVAVVGVWARVCGNLWRLPRAPADALFTSPNCGWCPGFNAGYETGSLAARTVGAVHGMLSVLELMVAARSDSYVGGGGQRFCDLHSVVFFFFFFRRACVCTLPISPVLLIGVLVESSHHWQKRPGGAIARLAGACQGVLCRHRRASRRGQPGQRRRSREPDLESTGPGRG